MKKDYLDKTGTDVHTDLQNWLTNKIIEDSLTD